MKKFGFILTLLIALAPLTSRAETVSIDPPAEPIVVATPSVDIRLTPDTTSVRAGQAITYTLTITNQGTVPVTNLRATFDLPADFSFTGGTSPSALKKLGNLPAGNAITKSFTLTVGDNTLNGRVPLEMLVEANEFGPNETVAVVEITTGKVLGAETLVETGTSPVGLMIGGISTIVAGFFLRRRFASF